MVDTLADHFRDREWQKWPVTIVTGAYIGFAVGKLAGGLLFRGKIIKFDQKLE